MKLAYLSYCGCLCSSFSHVEPFIHAFTEPSTLIGNILQLMTIARAFMTSAKALWSLPLDRGCVAQYQHEGRPDTISTKRLPRAYTKLVSLIKHAKSSSLPIQCWKLHPSDHQVRSKCRGTWLSAVLHQYMYHWEFGKTMRQ